jgi:Acyl-CoA carboxylase epsilon subunit
MTERTLRVERGRAQDFEYAAVVVALHAITARDDRAAAAPAPARSKWTQGRHVAFIPATSWLSGHSRIAG